MSFIKHSFVSQVSLLCIVICGLALLPACTKSSPKTDKNYSSQAYTKKHSSKERRQARKQTAKITNKPMNVMTYHELREAASYAVSKDDKHMAILYKKRMIALCDTPEDLSGLMLDIADLLYAQNDAVLAGKMYMEFTKLYPGSEKYEYASHRAIVCSFAQTLDADRDQTKTRDTLELAEAFLVRPLFTTFRDAVKAIKAQCEKKLFESEMGVVTFYAGRGDYKTALRRIEQMRVEFTPIMPEAEVYLVASEINIADQQRDTKKMAAKEAEYEKIIAELSAPHQPAGVRVAIAERTKSKTPFVNRF